MDQMPNSYLTVTTPATKTGSLKTWLERLAFYLLVFFVLIPLLVFVSGVFMGLVPVSEVG
jgi:hypothetical protein